MTLPIPPETCEVCHKPAGHTNGCLGCDESLHSDGFPHLDQALRTAPQTHRVFVYGTLKRGIGNHYLLKSSKFAGPAITARHFGMIANGFPMLLDNPGDPGRAPVKGEAYEVDDATLARLDRLEGYRGEGHPANHYDRKVEWIKLWTGSKLCRVQAYVYVGTLRSGWMQPWTVRNSTGQLEWPRATS